jgi:glycosyltransferase involved in cell wall biosynthesis
MKKISIVSSCYNEEDNLDEFFKRTIAAIQEAGPYDWEIIVIDNHSEDGSREILKKYAAQEPRIKAIFNSRNFGHIRSPYHGILQGRGDAVIFLASDLQDPPEMIKQFIAAWEGGAKVVAAIKNESEESPLFFLARKTYYNIVAKLSDVDLLKNFTGCGLYDQTVIEHLRNMQDPYPYFRGQISELGFPVHKVPFLQPTRKRGFSKNNFYTLYDIAMLGFTNHTKIPLRLASMLGFTMSALCFTIGFIYLLLKLIYWNTFQLGLAPIVIGLFFTASIQLLFIGIIGEYIGAILTKVTKRPLVTEAERINF